MSKRKKKIRTEKKSNEIKDLSDNLIVESKISRNALQKKTFLMHIAKNSKYVGALEKMLSGCIACLVVVSILFAVPGLGNFYERTVFTVFSFIPKNYFPPDVYLPGVMMIVIFLLIIAGFAINGYKKGSEPFEFKQQFDSKQPDEQKSLKEKLLLFVISLAIGFAVIYFKHKSEYPEQTIFEYFQHPFFIALVIILIIGISYMSFTKNENTPFVVFVLFSGLVIVFTLFLIGLLLYFFIKVFLHVLNL
ncbi:hypothetical protein BH20ACI4_BH20ACI4_09530 [soil metagenome]